MIIPVKNAIDAWNLIGDSLYLIGPIEDYIKTHPDTGIAVAKNLGGEYIERHFLGRVPVVFKDEFQPIEEVLEADSVIRPDVSKAHASRKHIREAYCDQLGVPWDGQYCVPMGSWVEEISVEPNEDVVWVAPFSVSGTTNKMIFRDECHSLLDRVGSRFLDPLLLGVTNYDPPLHIPVIPANDIEDFIMMVRGCRMLICCDNGVSHLASAIGVKTRVFWKRCVSEDWIAPTWGRDTRLCYSVQELLAEIDNA